MTVYNEGMVQEVQRLHKQGVSTREIARIYGINKSTVYRWVNGFAPQNKENGVCTYVLKDRPVKGGITAEDIARIRRKTRIGSRLRIQSWKCQDMESQGRYNGRLRRVKVIDNTHPRFCTVEHPGGVREEILWVELIMKSKEDKKDV